MDAPQEGGAGDRLRARYRALQAEQALRADPAQAQVIEALAELADALAGYGPGAGRDGWLDRLRGREPAPSRPAASTSTGPSGAASRC